MGKSFIIMENSIINISYKSIDLFLKPKVHSISPFTPLPSLGPPSFFFFFTPIYVSATAQIETYDDLYKERVY